MAWALNRVQLLGTVGKDPEIRTTQTGTKIVNLSVATRESWNDRQSGERKERTEWHRVVIFNDRLADVAEGVLRKGRKVYIEGGLGRRVAAAAVGLRGTRRRVGTWTTRSRSDGNV